MTISNALNAAFAANQLIYASSATQLVGLGTATNAILVTNAGGIPSFQATIPLLVQQNITELGAIASIGAPLNQQFGGTGINNTGTITLGGSLTTTGAYNSTFNMTGTTSITFPTSGVLATTVGVGVLTVTGTLNKISCTGGQNPVISIDPNYVGQTSITTLGTITTGVFEGSVISLAYGGTNANLTASNGGIFYSTATATAILSGIATADKVLLSGSSTAPSWSTATYPATTTANQLLYSSANNTITGLATAADSVLVTNIDGVPSISGTLPSAVQQGITELGTITYMIEPLGAAFGGTGVNNGASTITLADSLTTTGAYPVSYTHLVLKYNHPLIKNYLGITKGKKSIGIPTLTAEDFLKKAHGDSTFRAHFGNKYPEIEVNQLLPKYLKRGASALGIGSVGGFGYQLFKDK